MAVIKTLGSFVRFDVYFFRSYTYHKLSILVIYKA